MTHTILHASPRSVAIAGLLPFSIALVSQLLARGHSILFPVAIYLGLAMVLAWCWIVGHALNARLSPARRPPVALFRFSVVFCAAYFAYFLVATFGDGILPLARFPVLFLALHGAAMGAVLSVLHFVGSNLSLVEEDLSHPADSTWSTTLTLFSIAGILAIQGRVNRIFERF